jgi:hypothetical protein
MNPLFIIIPVVIVMLILIFFNNSYSSIEILLFVFMVIIIGIIGTQYFFGINLTATIQNLFTKPELDIAIVQPSNPPPTNQTTPTNLDMSKPQTYHVQGKFDYLNAKAVCKAYNGQIANIKQVMDAYEKGGEWCDYGWSDDHMVLYPTQYKSWKSYQELGKKEQCGRPGVNGGYNNNLSQQLGVNCFGKKPKLNGPMPKVVLPPNAVDKRVEYWQTKLPTLTVSPFNYNAWNE